MTPLIRPLQLDDLDDLSRFLTAGFHAAPDADFASPEVLRWKYLESWDDNHNQGPRSFLARDEAGAVIGHIGISLTAFEGVAIPGGRIATLHMLDWLGSAGYRSVGVSLMRKANECAPTQFGLGGSTAARKVSQRARYDLRGLFPVYQRVLRPAHWLRVPDLGLSHRSACLARDLVRSLARPPRTAGTPLECRRVVSFGDWWLPEILGEARKHAVLTDRGAARLNHFLRFPRQAISGWELLDGGGRTCGFGLLNVVPQHQGRIRIGKIVDCLLRSTDVDLWHAAVGALTHELDGQGADVVQALASTPWMTEGLRRSGFCSRFDLEFNLRDRQDLVPRDVPFHFTLIEADYAYT
jgi:hypothetical protein